MLLDRMQLKLTAARSIMFAKQDITSWKELTESYAKQMGHGQPLLCAIVSDCGTRLSQSEGY